MSRLSATDGTGRLAIFTVPSVPSVLSCFSETGTQCCTQAKSTHLLPLTFNVTCAEESVAPRSDCSPTDELIRDQRSVVSTAQSIHNASLAASCSLLTVYIFAIIRTRLLFVCASFVSVIDQIDSKCHELTKSLVGCLMLTVSLYNVLIHECWHLEKSVFHTANVNNDNWDIFYFINITCPCNVPDIYYRVSNFVFYMQYNPLMSAFVVCLSGTCTVGCLPTVLLSFAEKYNCHFTE